MKPNWIAGCLVVLSSVSAAQEWTRFRGPNGTGIASTSLPVEFGPEENSLWRAEVPFGSSSPVLTGDAVVVSGADDEHLYVVAVSRADGQELWTRTVERDRTQEVFKVSDAASPSPVSDGTNVYVFFPEMGLVSFDAEGELRWQTKLGPFFSFYGMSSSPILVNGMVILLCDQQQGSFIAAIDAKTGEERWKTERSGMIECWATPVLYPADAPREVIVFGSYYVTSHSIETGKELWRLKGFGYTPVCSPILDGDRLYVSVPDHGTVGLPDWETLTAMADANKDERLDRSELQGEMADHFGWADLDRDDVIVEEEWREVYAGMNSKDYGLVAIDLAAENGPTEVWRYKKGLPSIASPLLYEGVLYLTRDSGLVTLIDAETGDLLGRERLPDSIGECWPSPIAAGGRVYVTSSAGNVAVVEAGDGWNVLTTNEIGEDCSATPAVGDGTLYVRTHEAVWAFGADTPD